MTGLEMLSYLLEQNIEEQYIHPDQPMSDYTSFRAGGCALCLVEVHNLDEFRRVLKVVRREYLPYMIWGNGTNVLVQDQGYSGVAIMLKGDFEKIEFSGNQAICGGGASIAKTARMAAEQSLTGMEFACGIPGTVGGAVKMNAGCFGSDVSKIVKKVKVLTTAGEELTLRPYELNFKYRYSLFYEKKYTVLEAVFELQEGDKDVINETIKEYTQTRHEKQPLEYPNAGSIFKNPKGDSAGRLIEAAGLSGFGVGGAQVSTKHCGFIINKGNATASDITTLMAHVKRTVYKDSGILLEPELIVLGHPKRFR